MLAHTQKEHCGSLPRAGFTLIELLIVVAIIAVLAALGAGAYFQAAAGQQKTTTEQNIQKIYKMLMQQWQAVIDNAKGETLPSSALDPQQVRINLIAHRLIEQFPTSLNSMATPPVPDTIGAYATVPSYIAALATDQPPTAGTAIVTAAAVVPPPANIQSAAALYLVLKQGRRGMSFDVDTSLTSNEKRTIVANGKTITYLVDAWGSPLVFQLAGAGSNLHPVIISTGRDGILSPPPPGADNDNISSEFLR